MQLDTMLNTLLKQGVSCDKDVLVYVLQELQGASLPEMKILLATNQVKLDSSMVDKLAIEQTSQAPVNEEELKQPLDKNQHHASRLA